MRQLLHSDKYSPNTLSSVRSYAYLMSTCSVEIYVDVTFPLADLYILSGSVSSLARSRLHRNAVMRRHSSRYLSSRQFFHTSYLHLFPTTSISLLSMSVLLSCAPSHALRAVFSSLLSSPHVIHAMAQDPSSLLHLCVQKELEEGLLTCVRLENVQP